jgi:hypothetical protein
MIGAESRKWTEITESEESLLIVEKVVLGKDLSVGIVIGEVEIAF